MDKELQDFRIEEERRLSDIDHELREVVKKLAVLQDEVSELVAAWKAASIVVGFVKLLGSVAIAATAIYAWFKGH